MRRLDAVTAAILLTLGACGGGGSDPDPAAAPPPADRAFPVTVTAGNGDVTIPTRPDRIISLSPTATEMLFAVGAGDRVVAVDDQSTYPPDAPTTKLSGLEPNVEAIAGYEPDLLVMSDASKELERALEDLAIPLVVEPAAQTLEDTYDQILDLGRATGNEDTAAAEVERLRQEIDAIVASVPEVVPPLTYYHELDDTYFTATSETFIGHVYALLGLENIADGAKGAASGYPQLSAEYIIDADPDLIFLADTKCCGQSAATVADRPGWDSIRAVKTGSVVELDDDVASRWGPRIAEFLRSAAAGVERAAGAKTP